MYKKEAIAFYDCKINKIYHYLLELQDLLSGIVTLPPLHKYWKHIDLTLQLSKILLGSVIVTLDCTVSINI